MNWNYLSKYRSEIMGAACLWIMLFHNYCSWPEKLKPIELFLSYGNVGVDVFLLVSGIGLYYSYSKSSTLENGAALIKDFYKKRIVRLLVPYLFLALPYYIWFSYGKGAGAFIRNFFQINFPRNGLTTSWYVTAAFVFYLLFPLIYHFQEKKYVLKNGVEIERNTVTLVMCALMFAGNLVLKHLIPGVYENCEIALTRIIIFTIGCSVGKEVKEKRNIPLTWVLSGAVFMIVYMFLYYPQVNPPIFWYRMEYIPFGLSTAWVMAYGFHKLKGCERVRKIFTFLGDRSLELYLCHVFVKRIWRTYLGDHFLDRWDFGSYFCILVIALIISIAVHPLIKKVSERILNA